MGTPFVRTKYLSKFCSTFVHLVHFSSKSCLEAARLRSLQQITLITTDNCALKTERDTFITGSEQPYTPSVFLSKYQPLLYGGSRSVVLGTCIRGGCLAEAPFPPSNTYKSASCEERLRRNLTLAHEYAYPCETSLVTSTNVSRPDGRGLAVGVLHRR